MTSFGAAVASVLQSFQHYELARAARFEQSDGPVHRAIPRGETKPTERAWSLFWIGASAALAVAIDGHFGTYGTAATFDFYPPPDITTPVRVCYAAAPQVRPDNGAFSITVTLQEF